MKITGLSGVFRNDSGGKKDNFSIAHFFHGCNGISFSIKKTREGQNFFGNLRFSKCCGEKDGKERERPALWGISLF